MRRLDQANDERGAVAVIVAILLVVLLGFAALAVDVGMLYAEKAQLRNGADATALAIAQTCAKDTASSRCSDSTTAGSLAKQLVDANALDGQSNPRSITLNKTAGTVSVTNGALEPGAATNRVSLHFARALGITDAEVTATSKAAWGAPSGGTTLLPLAVAECKFNLDIANPTTTLQTLDLDHNGCAGVPGGFGWIKDSADGKCSVTIKAGASNEAGIWFESDTGAAMPTVCSATDLHQLRDKTVLLPLFALATGTGSSGKYYVKGFAAFHVTAYAFPSEKWPSTTSLCNKCIRGYFVEFVGLDHNLTLGPAPSYGADLVKLTP